MGQMRKRSDKTRLAQGGRDTNARRRRISILFLHGFPVCLLPGREKHVSPVSDPVSGLSSGHAGDSAPGSAHQSQRARSHRRGWTHVHQQPGDAHQIPRLTVRPPDLRPLSPDPVTQKKVRSQQTARAVLEVLEIIFGEIFVFCFVLFGIMENCMKRSNK